MRKGLLAICLVLIVLAAVAVPSCAMETERAEGETFLGDAIDIVVTDLLPQVPNILQRKPHICITIQDPNVIVSGESPVPPLPRGTVIEEASGSTLSLTLQEDMYFFYLDLAPGCYYAHDVKYIFVGKNGNHEEYDAEWWPLINGVVPEELAKFPPNDADVIASNVELEIATGVPLVCEFEIPQFKSCEGFIVVQGLMAHNVNYSDAEATYLNGIEFFNEYKNECSRVEGLVQSQAADVLDIIDDMVEERLSPITIYIIAHGNVDGVRLGGEWFTANQFRNKMAAHPDTIFNFILGSCHSGSFIDDLDTLDNVCAVLTACSADEGAWPDWDTHCGLTDFNSDDTGSEFTSSLLEAMSVIAGDEDKFTAIINTALKYGVPPTSVLICHGGWGALGADPGFGLTQDLDLSHRCGVSTPRGYCSWETIE